MLPFSIQVTSSIALLILIGICFPRQIDIDRHVGLHFIHPTCIEPFLHRLHVGFVCMKCRKRKNLDLIIYKTLDRLYALKIYRTICYIFLN